MSVPFQKPRRRRNAPPSDPGRSGRRVHGRGREGVGERETEAPSEGCPEVGKGTVTIVLGS